jgi:hypothetical protein
MPFALQPPSCSFLCAPALEPFLLPVLRSLTRPYGSPAVHHRHRPAGMGALDGDDAVSESAGDRRPAGGECGCAACGVDRAVGEGPSSQPTVRLRRQLVRFHKRGFAALASRFMRALCYHYGVELVVWTSLGPLPRWVPGPTTRWAHGTTQLALHGT